MSVSELNKEKQKLWKKIKRVQNHRKGKKGKRQLTFISNAYLKSKGTGFIRCLNFFGTFFIHLRLIYSEAGDKKEVVPWQP